MGCSFCLGHGPSQTCGRPGCPDDDYTIEDKESRRLQEDHKRRTNPGWSDYRIEPPANPTALDGNVWVGLTQPARVKLTQSNTLFQRVQQLDSLLVLIGSETRDPSNRQARQHSEQARALLELIRSDISGLLK